MKKVYIAAGWFNEQQAMDLKNIKNVLKKLNIPFFSPKDEFEVKPGDSLEIQKNVFKDNIKWIKASPFIIANTRDKDMGTVFECGIAFSNNIPIIYYCDGLKGNFNLMLGQSGIAVSTNVDELINHIRRFLKDETYKCEYIGKIE